MVGVMVLGLAVGPRAWAQTSSKMESASAKSRVFLLTATYGVVAGTLTGLGSLAFYKSPGDHTRNVAMGASLGLYMGILLGAYMVYMVPDPNAPRNGAPGAAPGSKGGGSGPVLEDPLRLGITPAPQSFWAPYFAYNEVQKSMVVGFHYQY